MNLRRLCRCGHVRGSHVDEDGRCLNGTCPCRSWVPAYPVLDVLPAGVNVLREYRSGLALVACAHAQAGGARCGFCHADPHMTDGHRLLVKRLAFPPADLVLFA